ncbi:MAG: hypothetical protein H0U03_08565 [Actinobacteria bacterium]|nr:hypothetical protein [Actinomycetota bacterium]
MSDRRTSSYVAECYWPGVTEASMAAAGDRARAAAADLRGEGHDIEYRGSIFMPDDETVLYLVDSTSSDAVRDMASRAEVPWERVVESIALVPDAGSHCSRAHSEPTSKRKGKTG